MPSPRPAQVWSGLADGSPFVGCFRRFEAELAAAIYVEICILAGEWRPVGPRDFGMFLSWAMESLPQPWWVRYMGAFRISPDIHALVAGGWFVMDDQQRIEPTDSFFAACARYIGPPS